MPTRTERVETRVTPQEAARLRFAANLARTSLSSFVIGAAVERAEQVIASHSQTLVPGDYFDQLLEALDQTPHVLPGLSRAVQRAKRQGRRPER